MSRLNITNVKTEVKHSESKLAFNVVGKTLGGRYKIARFPYFDYGKGNEKITHKEKSESFVNASLYVDAHNTYNECGILPSDLLRQRDDAIKALKKIIEMNYQNALDQYGDRSKAKIWSCVVVAEECLNRIENPWLTPTSKQ